VGFATVLLLAGAGVDDGERARGVLGVVLVELGELETHLGIVDGRGQRLEIGERAGLVAAGLVDLGAGANAGVACPASERSVDDLVRAIIVSCTLQCPGHADEVLGVEHAAFERLTVEADDGGHGDDVPPVVIDDPHERARVPGAEKVQVALADLAGGHVVLAYEAEDLTLDGAEPRAEAASVMEATRDMHEIEMRRLVRERRAPHDEARAQDREIEALAVERHQHRRLLDALGDAREDGRLFTELAHEELLAHEADVLIPEREADQERDGARPGPEAGGLGVEVERTREIACGEARIEREEREQLARCGARPGDGDAADAMRARQAKRADVERAELRALDGERQLGTIDGGELARGLAAGAREDRVHASAEIVEK
jgi:hypothetical protein